MAPSPEYDKEPKAPDKTTTNISCEDTKVQYNSVNEQQTNSDHKTITTSANTEIENNKDVEALDDGQLRALLDEAITYKCPKDREGKSSLFKELLEEVEQDEQACEAAARSLGGCRGSKRGGRSRRALPHSNSLQDLVAALAAEPTRRHHARHAAPAPAPSSVSTRAIHGGSLPSGVDTSSLLSEEPARGAGYLATVRCVNPPPLAERRVSASDANAPQEMELLNRRSKPMFPMTYTARATLEIGSGSVCSGRAVTTTTASNQVRTPASTVTRKLDNRDRQYEYNTRRNVALGQTPPPRLPTPAASKPKHNARRNAHVDQTRLMSALRPKVKHTSDCGGGGGEVHHPDGFVQMSQGKDKPRGPKEYVECCDSRRDAMALRSHGPNWRAKGNVGVDWNLHVWVNNIDQWYQGLVAYLNPIDLLRRPYVNSSQVLIDNTNLGIIRQHENPNEIYSLTNPKPNNDYYNVTAIGSINSDSSDKHKSISLYESRQTKAPPKERVKNKHDRNYTGTSFVSQKFKPNPVYDDIEIENLRKQYRKRIGSKLVVPNLSSINPRNIRRMSIGAPPSIHSNLDNKPKISIATNTKSEKNNNVNVPLANSKISNKQMNTEEEACHTGVIDCYSDTPMSESVSFNKVDQISNNPFINILDKPTANEKMYNMLGTKVNMMDVQSAGTTPETAIELVDIHPKIDCTTNSFSQYMADQQKLFQALEATNIANLEDSTYSLIEMDKSNSVDVESLDVVRDSKKTVNNNTDIDIQEEINRTEEYSRDNEIDNEEAKCRRCSGQISNKSRNEFTDSKTLAQFDKNAGDTISSKRYILAELPNNAYIVLTLSKRLLTSLGTHDTPSIQIEEIESSNNDSLYVPENSGRAKTKKNKKKALAHSSSSNKKKDAINKTALKALLFESSLKYDRNDKQISTKPEMSPNTNNEVDSAIPFSCITTPEVVASCNTTSSSSQSGVAVDPKPLQLGSCYRAVASLTGAPEEPAGRCVLASDFASHPAPASVSPSAPSAPPAQPAPDAPQSEQPRSVISSSFNGLPLSRPNYGSIASTAPDDYKKSLDENGNAVQGFSSPLAGSAQQKKPRRKKSSKNNETVIDCRQIDGYQGDKDVNELLRFIESNAESVRAPKLGRAKHRDDADDKTGKKRSSERRKDKDKFTRASSLEELSRTTLEELTGPRPEPAPAKPERRSWGDTRDAPAPAPVPSHPVSSSPVIPAPLASVTHVAPVTSATDPLDPAPELTDFQTVTKKRKQRRRTDEPAPRRSRVPSPPSPRAAPASDRSNDSNDDLDSVHSLPPAQPLSTPHASYADIARTRNNIPDLIESCNFYAEGEGEPEGESEGSRPPEPPLPPPTDSDGYPALEPRAPTGTRRARDQIKQPPTTERRDRKDRPPQTETRAIDCPAPDVVADRRPPVILLDSTARPRDMDGITFGFDINEQLLSGSGRRPRCDLVRDAIECSADGAGASAGAGSAPVPVHAGCTALRYLAPDSPADTQHLHQIIDYVGTAWEDVIRCGTAKVRYFSE